VTAAPGARPPRRLGVAVVGFGWMGQVHARSWSRLGQHFPDVGVTPRFVAVADTEPRRREVAQQVYGFEQATHSWQDLLALDGIDVISVCGPNFVHREIGVAVAGSGRHLWVEKPAGRSAEETRAIAAAVHAAGVMCTVGFNYRNAPAVQVARGLVSSGELGTIESVDVRMLADYSARDLWPVVEQPPGAASVHLVIGDRSGAYPAADRERAARIAAGSARTTVDVLPAGHWVHVDDPDGLLRTLLDRVK